jgi:hypothetical protein
MWIAGRQGTGYFKQRIFEFTTRLVGMDCYILKYPVGAFVPPHTDPVTDFKHFRLNIVLKQAKRGGHLMFFKTRYTGRFILFRPDAIEHSVSAVTLGTRYVLSIGLALQK